MNQHRKNSKQPRFFLALLLSLSFYSATAFSESTYDDSSVLFKRGDYQRVIDLIEPSIENKLASANELPRLLRRLGEAHTALGNSQKAVTRLSSALKAAEQQDDRAEAARIMTVLGSVYAGSGVYEKATSVLQQSIEAAKALNRVDIALSAQNNLANVYARLAEYDKASALYDEVFTTAQDIGQYDLASKAALNKARSLLKRGNTVQAITSLKHSDSLLEKIESPQEKAYLLLGTGQLYSSLIEKAGDAHSARAFTLLKSALDLAKQMDDPRLLSYSLGYMAALYEKSGRLDDALALSRNALIYAQQVNANEILYRWAWQIGRIQDARNNSELAIASYEQSIAALRPIQHRLIRSSAIGESFRERVGPVYLELIEILLRRAQHSASSTDRQDTLARVRNIMEAFKNAELEDYFQDDCVATLNKRTRGIDALDSKTAAIYPIILNDKVSVLLSQSGWIHHIEIPVDAATFNKEVTRFRQRLEKRTTRQYLRHAKKIYDWVIRPLEGTLTADNIETLVIVPDGILRTVPFAALHDGKQFLIEKYALATTPGLSLTDPQPLNNAKVRMLANGLSESVMNYPPLPHVEEELASISNMHTGKTLVNAAFTQDNVRKALRNKPYNILHIASHGEFSSKSSDSFVLAYNEKLTLNDLEQYLAETRMRNSPVDLLTLSACQTAAGDERAALGLGGVAVKAGARTAVATLWFVSDEASSKLVAGFYQNLRSQGVSKAKAMQQAQLAVMQEDNFTHPGYWAPFLVIGNWL